MRRAHATHWGRCDAVGWAQRVHGAVVFAALGGDPLVCGGAGGLAASPRLRGGLAPLLARLLFGSGGGGGGGGGGGDKRAELDPPARAALGPALQLLLAALAPEDLGIDPAHLAALRP
jgi:hypothetical protein